MDKTDALDALVDHLNGADIEGFGHVLAAADYIDMFGTAILEVFPGEGAPTEHFRVRITKLRIVDTYDKENG